MDEKEPIPTVVKEQAARVRRGAVSPWWRGNIFDGGPLIMDANSYIELIERQVEDRRIPIHKARAEERI